jgi:hypothetical protein
MLKKNYFYLLFLAVVNFFFAFYSPYSLAWEHEVSLGFGGGQEIDQDYTNTIFVLNAKIYKFPKIDQTLIATIDASFSSLHSNTSEHNSLFAAAVTPTLRAYFINPQHYSYIPYLEVASGPAYLSKHQLGENQQGTLFVFQSTLGGGIEFVKIHGLDLNLHFAHYCNAGLKSPNQGFDFPFVVSLGYLW